MRTKRPVSARILVPTTATPFGHSLHLPTPADCDLVVVFYNKGGGWVPWRLLLPHQLYAEAVNEKLDELTGYPPYCEVAYVPIRSADIERIAVKEPTDV